MGAGVVRLAILSGGSETASDRGIADLIADLGLDENGGGRRFRGERQRFYRRNPGGDDVLA